MTATVFHRETYQTRQIREWRLVDHPVAEWIHEPDLSGIEGVERKYWTVDGDVIREMSTAEKDALVDQWKAERRSALVSAVTSYGDKWYPPMQMVAIRDEYLRAKTEGRTASVNYLQPTLDFDKEVTDEYRTRRNTIIAATTHAEVYAVSTDFSDLDAQFPGYVSVADARQMGAI